MGFVFLNKRIRWRVTARFDLTETENAFQTDLKIVILQGEAGTRVEFILNVMAGEKFQRKHHGMHIIGPYIQFHDFSNFIESERRRFTVVTRTCFESVPFQPLLIVRNRENKGLESLSEHRDSTNRDRADRKSLSSSRMIFAPLIPRFPNEICKKPHLSQGRIYWGGPAEKTGTDK